MHSAACSAFATIVALKPLSLSLVCDAAFSQSPGLSDAVRECTASVGKDVPIVNAGALGYVCRITWKMHRCDNTNEGIIPARGRRCYMIGVAWMGSALEADA